MWLGAGVAQNQAVRMAVVMVLTHIFFCHRQASQCLTPTKALAASVVSKVFSKQSRCQKHSDSSQLLSLTPNKYDGFTDAQNLCRQCWGY